MLRDAHPQAHGLVHAQFIVLDDLPNELRQGVFKKAGTDEALIRFSTGNIKVQPDTVPQARSMAIKLLGVEGEKILPAEKGAFSISPKAFLRDGDWIAKAARKQLA